METTGYSHDDLALGVEHEHMHVSACAGSLDHLLRQPPNFITSVRREPDAVRARSGAL